MTIHDPIADLFVRVRNAQRVFKKWVILPASKPKTAIAKLMLAEGYLLDVQLDKTGSKEKLTLYLKYHQGRGVIDLLKRVSRPSCRVYRNVKKLPKVMGGLGVAIISTPQGMLSDRAARSLNVGGEVIGLIA
jgi:small subunit ribosomal protein S8